MSSVTGPAIALCQPSSLDCVEHKLAKEAPPILSCNRDFWERQHLARAGEARYPTPFAVEVVELLNPRSTILELGCAAGRDGIFFIHQGHKVVGLDLSLNALRLYRRLAATSVPHVKPWVICADLRNMPVGRVGFDAVYARMSLHYFGDGHLENIVSQISGMLRLGGHFALQVRSLRDPLYGRGEPLFDNAFVFDRHLRRFFDMEALLKLLDGHFQILKAREAAEWTATGDRVLISAVGLKVEISSKSPAGNGGGVIRDGLLRSYECAPVEGQSGVREARRRILPE
jgi:SAM-dependent methyltransferase